MVVEFIEKGNEHLNKVVEAFLPFILFRSTGLHSL
jgi:hypothetical protein